MYPILPPCLAKKNNTTADMIKAIISIYENAPPPTPPKIATGRPATMPILKIFYPTILPIAISYSPFFVAITEVTNSGSEVPSATIVSEIIL